MSDQRVIADSEVFTVYSWFQSAMKNVGRKINFPKCKDKTKTYQFRWTKSFVNRCYNDLEIDDKVMKALVYDMVAYAKRENLLSKGTQILSLSNIADICYESICSMMNDEQRLIKEIRSCHQFVLDQADGKDSPVRIFQNSNKFNGIPNLVYWYNQGHITDVYLALSKSCVRALNKIPEGYRSDLPSNYELLRICTHTLMEDDLVPTIKEILGKDLRMPKTLRS